MLLFVHMTGSGMLMFISIFRFLCLYDTDIEGHWCVIFFSCNTLVKF